MIRISLISAATYGYMGAPRKPGSFHGTAFASAFNGYDAAKKDQYQWTFAAARRQLDGAQVVKIWDPEREWAERLADVCSIPEVCDSPEQCAEGVDAAIVVDDGSGSHARYGIEPLKQGIPTFIDKPIALTGVEAARVVDVARVTGTPLMSASSLRFLPDVLALREEMPEIAPVHLATSACGNELVYYGIHALETAYAVLGPGAVSCMNVGQEGRNVVRVRFRDGRDLLLLVSEPEWMQEGFQISLYGKRGWRSVEPDLTDLYLFLMERFLRMVRTGERPMPLDEIVEVIAVLEAGKRSLELGREVTLEEVLPA
jgi:predicted dehydrogenase